MNWKYPFEKEITPLLLLTTLLLLGWHGSVTFPDHMPVFWNLPGLAEVGLSKTLAVWLIPLAGLALYTVSLTVSLVPSSASRHLRQARIYHVGKALTLWAMLGVYLVVSLSALTITLPTGLEAALGIGLLLFFVSALSN